MPMVVNTKKKHLFGGKKHKLTDKDREPVVKDVPVVKDREPVVKDREPIVAAPTPDMNKVRDGDVVSNGEKVKDKYELKEADHIGDKYISKRGWDLGQNLGKRYDDADSYKLKDEDRHYVPDDERVDAVRPVVTTAPTYGEKVHGEKVQGDRLQGDRLQGDRLQGDRLQGDRLQGDRLQGDRLQGDRPYDERVGEVLKTPPPAPVVYPLPPPIAVAVPSAHGERVYSHERKDGDKLIGDKPQLHREEGGILSDEHRLDKSSGVPLKDKDYVPEVTEEPHKKGVIGKVIEKVKEKFSSNKSSDTIPPDPTMDKGHQWEQVPDERNEDASHWKDRGVVKGDKNKSKETY